MRYVIVVILTIVLTIFVLTCREAITDNDIDYSIVEVCDTINSKWNPRTGYWQHTIRCIDQYGNERTYLIVDKP